MGFFHQNRHQERHGHLTSEVVIVAAADVAAALDDFGH